LIDKCSFSQKGINIWHIIAGTLCLLFGALIYFSDRPQDQIYFITKFHLHQSFISDIPRIFGAFGGCLPSFFHVMAFSFITAGIIASTKRGYLLVCSFWLLIDLAFEVGQYFRGMNSFVPDWFVGMPFIENTKNFFLYGTFDVLDIAGIAIGTLIVYFALIVTNMRKRSGR